jgi:hypothetical protein
MAALATRMTDKGLHILIGETLSGRVSGYDANSVSEITNQHQTAKRYR